MTQEKKQVMTEFMRNNGPSESNCAGDSAVVRGSPCGANLIAVTENTADDSAAVRGGLRGAGSTAARQSCAAATAGGDAR